MIADQKQRLDDEQQDASSEPWKPWAAPKTTSTAQAAQTIAASVDARPSLAQ